MFSPKRILVPVDFSPCAWTALEDAAAIAKNYNAEIDVLHVWDLPLLVQPQEVVVGSGLPPSVIEAISGRAHQLLERFVGQARSKGIAIRNAQAVAGEPYRTIVETAERGQYDLIVIGTHGRKNLARVFLGSVAERVVRHASCPVLVARPDRNAVMEPVEAPPTPTT